MNNAAILEYGFDLSSKSGMGFEDFLRVLDQAMPSQRLSYILKLNEKNNIDERLIECHRLLLCLYGIDYVIREKTGKDYFFYIQDDQSLINLMNMCGFTVTGGQESIITLLAQLGLAQLVYRFNIARKFSMDDEITKQLRINSWGRYLLTEEHILDLMDSDKKTIIATFEEYYSNYRDAYENLANLLLQKITPDVAQKIQDINSTLNIKIVS
jgi:hypothetical protein